MQLTENAKKVLANRILKKDEEGNVIESPDGMVRRVAETVAEAELYPAKWKYTFADIMDDLYFLPNSPCLANSGTSIPQLQACFTLPIEDNMQSIFGTLADMSEVFRTGGGVGFSVSRLRPKGDKVRSTGGFSSGPVSFLEPYNAAINAVRQGGRRKGAGLVCMDVDHPDILDFIECKKGNDKFNNFNISVAVTDRFMDAVKEDQDFDLINPRTGIPQTTVYAREIWDKIVEGSHRNGEPGLLFIDKINKDNPTPDLGRIETVNACSEFHGLPYESCNLGSINLSKMVKYDRDVDPMVDVHWQLLTTITSIATRFLDNILDVTEYPLEQIKDISLGNRKIGLGVMGWGDMLYKLGIPYNSEEALKLAYQVMGCISEEAKNASHKLAEEKGLFPNWKRTLCEVGVPYANQERRNAALTSIAPTGTLSIIADCTSGIEPAYALVYEKHVLDGQTLYETNSVFMEELKHRNLYSEELIQKIADNHGSCQGIPEIPEDMQRIFVVAHDISPEWHVRMQAQFQQQVDMGISKTINTLNDATQKDIEDAFLLAYELGCKGITVYRDGSRDEQVLTSGTPKKPKVSPRTRPVETLGSTTRLQTGCGKLYATVNEDKEGVCELLLNQRDGNGCRVAYNNSLAMVISMALRAGVEISDISKALKGQSCGQPVWAGGKLILSCPDAIGKHLDAEQEFQDFMGSIEDYTKIASGGGVCKVCGGRLIPQGGCVICLDCNYERCGG